ncbi:MAG: GWxTD domain-containing protein [Vicingaceae bacterium]
MKPLVLSVFVGLALVFLGCRPSQRVARNNLAYLYYDDPTIIHPSFDYFHESQATTSLYIRLRSSEILYSKNNPEKTFLSRMVFQINVYEDGNQNKLVTSDTIFFLDKGGPDTEKYLIGKAELELPTGKDYFAEVTLDDQYRMQYVQDIVLIRKKDELTSGHFIVRDLEGNIQFDDYQALGSIVDVQVSPMLGSNNLKAYLLNENTVLPAPPFSVQENRPKPASYDSLYPIELNKSMSFQLTLNERGLYHVTQSDVNQGGLSILVGGYNFPYIQSTAAMVGPLRYITTRSEYSSILESVDQKKDLDAFWYNLAGNAERAREIIDTYYSRVELANKNFTTDRTGWRTDRGLVYIIYGPPNTVTKNQGLEKWIYNEKNNIMAVEFTFIKVNNAFSDKDFMLSRSGGFKSSWYRAIDNWRQGRVFQ